MQLLSVLLLVLQSYTFISVVSTRVLHLLGKQTKNLLADTITVSITVGIITTAQMWVLVTGPLGAKTFGDVFFLCTVFYCCICALLVGGFLSGW
jgi:hypothetical protein